MGDAIGMVHICDGQLRPIEPGDPLHQGRVNLVVPLYEDCVLYAGRLVNATPGLRGIGMVPAMSCVDRLLQRRSLDPTGLNPLWTTDREPASGPPWVVKFPASTLSQGVRIVGSRHELAVAVAEVGQSAGALENVDQLTHWTGQEAPYQFLVESFIPGDQFEISGVVGERGNVLHWFHALAHTWSHDHRRIERYSRADSGIEQRLRVMCSRVVQALGLEWCGFCAEFKGGGPERHPWKIIEIHARLGQDKRPDYYAALTGLPVESPDSPISSSDRIMIDVLRNAAVPGVT